MVTLLLDIRKCFDSTGCDPLWRWGLHHGFPRVLLRMVLRTFELPRRIVAGRFFSREVRTSCVMVAGSCFSIALLHMMFITPCDTLIRNAAGMQGVTFGLTKYVDDLTLSLRGSTEACGRGCWEVFDMVSEAFQE